METGRTLLVALSILTALAALLVARTVWDDPSTGPDVVLVGDSFLEQSRDQFRDLADEAGMDIQFDAYGGTSVCSWWDRLDEIAASPPPVLVLSFAGNDLHECSHHGEPLPRPPEDVATDYRADLETVLDMFAGHDTEVYVAPPPPVGVVEFDANAQAMRDMYADLTTDADVTLVDTLAWLDPDDQGFQMTLPCEPWDHCPAGQDEVTVRQDDLIHLTPAGGERYARAIYEAVTADGEIN